MTDVIPSNNTEFANQYARYVAEMVGRLNNRSENLADIIQAVWLRLLESDVITKFHARVRASRPSAFTTTEVCLHLGIEVESWTVMQAMYGEARPEWMPCPIAGDATSLDALWSVDDVERYEPYAHLHHQKVAESQNLIPQPSVTHFNSYIALAVHNAFANWVRTHSRRHKERPLDAFTRIPLESRRDDRDDLLVSMAVDHPRHYTIEAHLELQEALGKFSIEDKQEDFLTLLERGYTAVEAAQKLRFTPRQKARIAKVVGG